MNKPILPPVADDDIGPLDEHGQQIWPAAEEAAIARVHADPAYIAAIQEALASADRGEVVTSEQLTEHMDARRRRWFAERGLAYRSALAR